ncbi:MAG: hypothetical protein KDM63_01780, partial [Verrucomicrobiae bacterium]|nr:hypothetical protein [Verrucomicrobiae bacterium]
MNISFNASRSLAHLVKAAWLLLIVLCSTSPCTAGQPGKIAFAADFELWLMEGDGSGKTALGLSDTDFDAIDVQLSPGGDWLVFTGINWDTFENGLWLMRAEPFNALTNAPQLVGPDASYLKRASWHPAGGQVAYIGNDGKVYLVHVVNDQGEPVID